MIGLDNTAHNNICVVPGLISSRTDRLQAAQWCCGPKRANFVEDASRGGRIPNELNSRFFTPLTFSSDVTFYGAIFSSIDLIFCRDVLKTILKRGLRSDF